MKKLIIALILITNINGAWANPSADKRIKLLKRMTKEIKNKSLKTAKKLERRN